MRPEDFGQLDSVQVECLRKIAQLPRADSAPCSDAVLKQLRRAGLIETAPQLWLPLEMRSLIYRPTVCGWKVLHKLEACKRD
jgi:hypothetical protein